MPEFALSSYFGGQRKLDEKFFKTAAGNDFKAVELLIKPGHFRGRRDEINWVKKTAADYRTGIESVHCDMEILDPPAMEVFKRAREVILNNLDLAAELNAKLLVIHVYIFADPENIIIDDDGTLHPGLSVYKGLEDKNSGMLERVKDGMAFYAEEAKQRKVAIALETDTQKNEYLFQLIEKADPQHCGICFDTGHVQLQNDAVRFARFLAPRVICAHLHDNDGKKDLHLPPFKGTIDWENVLMELVKGGYKGTYTFECSGDMPDIVEARQKILKILNEVSRQF